MMIEKMRERAMADVKADMENWITEGTAVKGWYTCEKTGKKFRGEAALEQLKEQERQIDLMITVMQDIEMEEEMDEELSEEVQHKAKMALVNADMPTVEQVSEVLSSSNLIIDKMTETLVNHVALEQVQGKSIKLITINCEDCGAERLIKPQDAFQVKRCEDCQKKHRNAMRAQRRREKRAAEKAGQ